MRLLTIEYHAYVGQPGYPRSVLGLVVGKLGNSESDVVSRFLVINVGNWEYWPYQLSAKTPLRGPEGLVDQELLRSAVPESLDFLPTRIT